jgi:hypothetical protein
LHIGRWYREINYNATRKLVAIDFFLGYDRNVPETNPSDGLARLDKTLLRSMKIYASTEGLSVKECMNTAVKAFLVSRNAITVDKRRPR